MDILNFLIANWDSVAVVAVIAGVIVFLIVKDKRAILKKIIFCLVMEAEREFGGGTGEIKLAAVVARVYRLIPTIIRLFITEKQLVAMIERALKEAKAHLEKNNAIAAYVNASRGGS